ncbi:MAG: hypothetical protein ACJ71A_07880 [Nitrososphaeraceae archaeon]
MVEFASIFEQGRMVNNTGCVLVGPLEQISSEFAKHSKTNVFDAIRVKEEVLPIIRECRRGTIIWSCMLCKNLQVMN